MMLLQIIAEAVGQVLGGLVAASMFCWLCWRAFKLVHHPEMSAVLVLATLIAVWGFGLKGPLLNLTVVYAAVIAAWLWPAGLSWRRRHPF